MKGSRRAIAIAAAIAAVLIVLIAARHAIVRGVITKTISVASGYGIAFGDQAIGLHGATFRDVRVSRDGDPVLDAKRIDVRYDLRDVFPGGNHRYGLVAISVIDPVFTVTRNADGTLVPGAAAGASPPSGGGAPLRFDARLIGGTVRLVDRAPLEPDLASQTIADVSVRAHVDSTARSTVHAALTILGRETQGGAIRRYPVTERSLIDAVDGIALNGVTARAIPLRGPLNFFLHSRAVRFDAGEVDGVALQIFALGAPGRPLHYQLGGGMDLRGARVAVSVLASPIRDLRGRIEIADDTLTADRLRGSVAGLPLAGRGGFFDLTSGARAWLGIRGDGDIASLRTLFAFARKLPLAGPLHVETLVAGKLSDPLIRNAFTIPRLTYARYVVTGVQGQASVFDHSVVVDGIGAHYGAVNALLGGRILLGEPGGDDLQFAVDASGPGSSLPYADALAPDATVHADALVSEIPGVKGWLARGTVNATGPTDGGLTFAVDEHGVGEFGPLQFTRRDGESLAGGFELERPISRSAGWLRAHDFRLAAGHAPALTGVTLPAFPPFSGVLDGALVAGGAPSDFEVAGSMRGTRLRYENLALGAGSVRLAGTFDDLRLGGIRLQGPMGSFAGEAGLARGVFALQGRYDGSLDALRPFIGAGVAASGGVHGPIRAVLAGKQILVQTTGATLAHASIRGVRLDRVAGTLAVAGKSLRIVAADADLAGGRAVVADAGGPFLVSAPAIPARAIAGAGIPLQAGRLAIFGLADLEGAPRFDGSIALVDGRADGFPVSGGADVRFAGRTATIARGVAALGATYGDFAGTIGIDAGAPAYDLAASVPLGDVADVRRVMRLPLPTLEGSFSAAVHVGGSGGRPSIAGDVEAPEGAYHGLAFSDARAAIAVAPGALRATGGTVTVGSTRTALDAALAGGTVRVAARSADANLADFDDYFDEAEVLAGTGSFAFAFSHDAATTATTGRFALRGVRYRQFAIGDTHATWSQRDGSVVGALDVDGTNGMLRANGSMTAARGGVLQAFRGGSYAVRATATGVKIGNWLPALGITAPVLGNVSASLALTGRWPRLAVDLSGNLSDGEIDGFPVRTGTIRARGEGDRITLSDTVLAFDFARFTAAGSAGLAKTDPLALSIGVDVPDLGVALRTVAPKHPVDVGGALTAHAEIAGTLAHPRATAGFLATGARYRTLTVPRLLGNVGYDGATLQLRDVEATFAKGNAFLAGELPLALRPLRIAPRTPFSFTLAVDGLDLAPFAPFIPTPQTKLGGTANGRVALEGTADAPRLAGSLTLSDGSYVSGFDRAAITKANATLAFAGTSIALQALHADVGGGSVDGSGSYDLPFGHAPAKGYGIAIVAHAARFDLPAYASGQIDGNLSLRRGTQLPLVSGDVTLTNTTVPFSAILRALNAGGGGTAVAPPPFDLAFDLMMHAGRSVRVQGSIIDVAASGSLALTGTLQHPILDGRLAALPGGVLSTFNHAFRIQQASVTFTPATGLDPYIDARAFAHVTNPDPDPARNVVGSADITITARGQGDELAAGQGITYSSNPPYDQAEIIGLLFDASVFGAINFGQQQNGTVVRGAPPIENPLLPPGVTPYEGGVLSFQEEAFSVLNGQLVQHFLAPVESVLTGPLGLSDLELTIDYGGGIGYEAYKQIGRRDLYANFGQDLTTPVRTTVGFTARPDATTSVTFSYFEEPYAPAITYGGSSLFETYTSSTSRVATGIVPLNGRQGFTFSIVRKYP